MRRSRVSRNCVLAAALSLACACPAFAGINTFATDIEPVQAKGDAAAVTKMIAALEQAHVAQPTLETGNDLGVARLLTGKYDEAVALFRETDQKFPGSARLAANLGTALELKGEDEEALQWIRESVKRDANEHEGSEWLHARILVAKIAFRQDPKWFEKNHVLELDFGTGEVPTAPEILPIENGRIKGAEQLIHQTRYQLVERMKFVKPPDPFSGDLHASMGDLMIAGALSPLDGGDFSPVDDYENALKYGAPRSDLVRRRLARYRADFAALPPRPETKEPVAGQPIASKRFDKTPARSMSSWLYVGIAAVIMIALLAIGMFIDRRRRRLAELNPPPPLPDVD